MKIEKTEVIHSINVGISAILKGLFCILAIWFGIWLIQLPLGGMLHYLISFYGGVILGAAWMRLCYILIKELW